MCLVLILQCSSHMLSIFSLLECVYDVFIVKSIFYFKNILVMKSFLNQKTDLNADLNFLN